VVFAGVASACVPEVSDSCTIEIVEESGDGYRIVSPPGADSGREPVGPERQLTVVFDGPRYNAEPAYEGRAVFSWHSAAPSRDLVVLLIVVIDRAVRTVAWQRSENRTSAATSWAETWASRFT
jgi:hypothetical protein